MTELNKTDYNNILALLARVPTQGLAEAQTLVVLAEKVHKLANPIVAVEIPAQG